VQPRAGDGFRVFDNVGRDFDFAFPVPPVPPVPPAIPDFDTFFWRAGSTLGVTVQELSPQLSEYFGVKDGVLVTSVTEQSTAAKAGLKAGDVITSINGASIGSSSELRRQTQRLNAGEDFTVAVTRDRKSVTLKGQMDERNRRTTFRTIV